MQGLGRCQCYTGAEPQGGCVLKIPCLVELSMMAMLDDAGVEVKVDNVVVRGSVAEEYALEVMTVQFPMPNA